MKKITALTLILFLLAGCRTGEGAPGALRPTGTPVPTAETTTTPTPEPTPGSTETPAPESPFGALPVTEEGIWDYYLYEEKGYYIIRGITPYEGDYLVELGHGYEGETLLVWIFGDTGRKVQMTTMESRSETEIRGRGVLHIRTGRTDADTWADFPETYTAVAPAVGEYAERIKETTWIEPRQSLRIEMFSGRYEQLCDACVTADGLSFSFIPSTDSMERFMSFFPACTSTPGFETSLDEGSGIFTLRLYNTSLKSGALTGEMAEWISSPHNYDGLYPRTIPEGSMERDNLFLSGVEIHQDGEDAVITARLTDRAGWFTVDCGNLGYDDIPYLCLRFREPRSMEVECGR